MGIFEIVVLGYVVNFGILIFLMVVTIINTLMNIKNAKYMLDFLELKKIVDKIGILKQDLRNKKISTLTQSNFIIFVPFTQLVLLYQVLVALMGHGLLYFLYEQIRIKHDILEARLHQSDK